MKPLTTLRIMYGCVVLLAHGAFAQDSDRQDWLRNPAMGNYKAYAEFKMTNYAKAREVWETLAEVGNGDVLFNLGRALQHGDKDASAMLAQLNDAKQTPTPLQHADLLSANGQHARAAEIYAELAAQNNADAQARLAWMYEAGRGVPQDLSEAARRFEIAANAAGHAQAQYALAVMLRRV